MVNTEVRKVFLAVFSIFGTVIFLLAMSCNAFADDITPVAVSSKFSVDVNNAVLELTILSTPAVIDLNPTMTGASFGSTSVDIKVATNNITGYTLTMTPTNLQTDTSLIRTEFIGDEEEYREIETLELTDPISTGYTEQTFTANKWGYKITGDNYYGIDPENTTVSHPAWVTDAPTNETHHNLTLAAKVDADTVSGAYETTLNFHAVTNAVPLVTLEMSYGFHGKQKVTIDNEEYYKMQDMTTEICSYANEIPSELEVVDIRDNTIYHIAKLLDGRCWLLDNLALDPVNPNVKATLSPENTNATQAAIDNYITSSGTAPQTGWATTAVSYETSTSVYNQPRIYIDNKDATRSTLTDPEDPLEDANDWKFGIYYNYCAASMGTYCYDRNSIIDIDTTSKINVSNDICPANWRMPTGGGYATSPNPSSDYEFLAFNYAYSSRRYTGMRKALRLPLSGIYSDGSVNSIGSHGGSWSVSAPDKTSQDYIFSLYSTKTQIIYWGSTRRDIGKSIRCIAK